MRGTLSTVELASRSHSCSTTDITQRHPHNSREYAGAVESLHVRPDAVLLKDDRGGHRRCLLWHNTRRLFDRSGVLIVVARLEVELVWTARVGRHTKITKCSPA
jgi:hypothetical protein